METDAPLPKANAEDRPAMGRKPIHSATIKLTQTTTQELLFAEDTLLGLYDKHLPAIRAASGVE